jgi:type VI secretion system secreted protein VgrG
MPSSSALSRPSAGLVHAKRVAKLKTPLGEDVLAITRFDGAEGLSEVFEYRIEALSEQQNIDFNAALGRNCSVRFQSYNGQRFFNGVLVHAQWTGVQHARHSYRLVLRPWFYLLTQKATCRIFSNKTAPDIIKSVFSDAGFMDFRLNLSESYPDLEYCVQYRETDFAFVSRLMEHFGIYYFFEHSEDKHVLVLADAKSSHKPVPGAATVPFIQLTGQDRRDREHLYHWVSERKFRTGKVSLNEYDYLQPNANLLAEARGTEGYEKSSLEFYDYPGKYPRKDANDRKKRGDGDRFAKVRLDAEQALDRRRHASGDAILLFPGGLFNLKQHPTDDGEYLVVRASHAFSTEAFRSGAAGEMGEIYQGGYELLRTDRVFRAPLVTPKPVVHGPQTARVVGAPGVEIDVDEHGRITVQFHWDRDKSTSRRVRVAQVWSGKSWGGQVIPRVGQEVVIEFIEGDPDRPLVVGTVFNNDYRYPYEMPAKKTQSGLKSDSTKGSGGFNEFRFEDKKSSEQVYLRAEKDYELLVRNTEKREIGEAYKGSSWSRKAQLKNGDDELYVDNGHQKIKIAKNQELTIGQNQTVKVGDTISVTAMNKIVFTVGPSKITMDNMGIKIEAPKIDLNGVAAINLKALLIKIN